jgi:hypothetical protein
MFTFILKKVETIPIVLAFITDIIKASRKFFLLAMMRIKALNADQSILIARLTWAMRILIALYTSTFR